MSEFNAVNWAHSTNIYEVNFRQYSIEGTFSAFAKEFPRLKDMGVQTLWFMPIHPIGEINRIGSLGSYYSIRDHRAINPEFGSPADFHALVSGAQAAGFKIIIDWVANHGAWDHVWTKEYPDFFERGADGNFRSPYDWHDVIQFNHPNPTQQDAMIGAMKYWVTEYGIDGFRCDMAHLVPLSFWERARRELDSIKPLFWLAETEEPSFHPVFDASYTWEFLHLMEKYARQQATIADIDAVLLKYHTNFPSGALRVYFTSNHDENSHSGSEYERMGDAALAFAVLCATWNGIPLVYSGQELPNKARLKFFDKDAIAWTGHYALHDFYKKLLKLHAHHPALRAGDAAVQTFRIANTDDEAIFIFLRKNGEKEALVAINLSEGQKKMMIKDQSVSGFFRNVFTGAEEDVTKEYLVESWGWRVWER